MMFGIDFGTTECCIAALDKNGIPYVIRNQIDGKDTLAAAVYFEDENNVIIGENARDMVEIDGDRVIQFAKRYLGKENAPYCVIDGKAYTAVEISALILMRLKQMALESGHEVHKAVLTLPAYFDMREKVAMINLAKTIGLDGCALLGEPAAIAYGYFHDQEPKSQNILVYDLGGATLDVTVLRWNPDPEDARNGIRILATDGNDRLGGTDWDNVLFDHILNICCEESGLYPDEIGFETRQLIRSRVEIVKKKLSVAETARVKIFVNDLLTTINITRDEFERLTEDKVEKTMGYVESVLKKYDGPIDQVVLTGGCAHMPMIQRALETRFPGKVTVYYPDTAVARGAALYAAAVL